MSLNFTTSKESAPFMQSHSLQERGLSGGESSSEVGRLVFHLIERAYQQCASDIHWEPYGKYFRIRFRIDGTLHEIQQLSKKLQQPIINRLKIMTGSINIAEKRQPQEGRFRVMLNNQRVDFRVSCIPTLQGESIVLRLLESSSLLRNLSELGLWPDDQAILERVLHQPDGLMLVTGPTGSGKTTTLYAALTALNTSNHKIITVEDPVEYQIPGINQVAVQNAIGRTFPVVLRSMLRQATNIMMVGEIRDSETASIAINAALTGHLLLSTLHTNDAISAIARLEDLGIPSFLISSTLHAVIAQRLVRRLCPHCKAPAPFTKYEVEAFQLTPEDLVAATPMRAVGCTQCYGRGFQGRLGIFEILVFDDEMRSIFYQEKSVAQRRQAACQNGMRSLRQDAVRKMLAGFITAQEAALQVS